MKRKRFSEEQIIAILKEAETGLPVKELTRQHGIAEGTFYRWKAKFGGMEVAAKRRRWGYRRLLVILRRQGFADNHKRIHRVYRQVRRRKEIAHAEHLRRPHARVHGNRDRHVDPRGARRARVGSIDRPARQTAEFADGQRPRVHRSRAGGMGLSPLSFPIRRKQPHRPFEKRAVAFEDGREYLLDEIVLSVATR